METLLTPALQRANLALSLVTLIYWALALYTNVYAFAIFGAVYEILWLPLIALVFLLPALSLYQVYLLRKELSIKSLPVLSCFCNLITIAMILLWNPPLSG
jgi:hypothetical protein